MQPKRLLPAGRALVPAVLLVAALAATAGRAEPAPAGPVSAQYQVYFGGLHVLDAQATWERKADAYRLAAQAETRGFVGWLSPWEGTTESRGRLAAGRVIPRHHLNWGTDDDAEGGERLIELSYDADGDLVDSLVQPAQDWDERHPLPPDAGEGTLDPLSVIAGLSQLLHNGGRCEGSFAVFDGRKRYDLFVSDAGETVLEPSSYSIYAGPARGCSLDYEMLGGHRIERNKYAETARKRIVWVARPAEGAPLVPVRLEIETAYGSVIGHLTGFAQGLQAEAKLRKREDRQVE